MMDSKSWARLPIAPALTTLSAMMAVACGDFTATEPAVPPNDENLTVAAAPSGVLATVRGGGHYQLKDPPAFVGDFKWMYRFSISASKNTDGTDVGTVKFLSHQPPGKNATGFPGGWRAEASIDCVEISNGTAWLSGQIVSSRTDSPFGPPVGDIAMFIVQDNGPNGVDEIDVGPAARFGASDCRDRPQRPPFLPGSFTDGNFTITSY